MIIFKSNIIVKRPLFSDLMVLIIVVIYMIEFDYSKGNLNVLYIGDFYEILGLLILLSIYGLLLVRKIIVVKNKVFFKYWFYKIVIEKDDIKEIKIKEEMRLSYAIVYVKNRKKRKFYFLGIVNTEALSNFSNVRF